jgi:hypothetical protein
MKLVEARLKAQKMAEQEFASLYSVDSAMLLDEQWLEAAHCWMFFRDQSLPEPPDCVLAASAFVVSKRTGAGRLVADFRGDDDRLSAYLQTMSDYFATHDE